MAENTKIEWAHHTFNPWIGCQIASPEGCKNCYAEKWANRYGRDFAQRTRTSAENWKQPLRWNAEAARLGVRYRVFCASLADVFDNKVPTEWRGDLWALINATPNLDWLLLTKRISNVETMMYDAEEPQPNVWIGITVCNQAEADRDIPKLLATPAAKRFLSMEPLMGAVDLATAGAFWSDMNGHIRPEYQQSRPHIDWVIAGGESGHNARPMHPDWARSLRDQCQAAGVPFLFKQWGEWKPISQMEEAEYHVFYKSRVRAKSYEDQGNLDDIYSRVCTVPFTVVHLDGSTHGLTDPMTFQQGTGAMQTFKAGKKAAGRLLDGVEHNGFPA